MMYQATRLSQVDLCEPFIDLTLSDDDTPDDTPDDKRRESQRNPQRKAKNRPQNKVQDMTECHVCCDLVSTLIPCLKCDFKLCPVCLKKIILEGQTEPCCCSCKINLPITFLITHLGKSWFNTTYKAKRKADLVREVKSNRAIYLQQIDEDNARANITVINRLRRIIESYMLRRLSQSDIQGTQAVQAKREIKKAAADPLYEALSETDLQLFAIDPSEAERVFNEVKADVQNTTVPSRGSVYILQCLTRYKMFLRAKINVKERAVFVQACPAPDCKGMLNQQYKCSTCTLTFCSRCFEPKVDAKANSHVCDENLVNTIKVIKSTSKKCPKCSERIEKESGCDQMWCPTCKVAFSWRTGKIESGYIHNPHYFEYLRSTNQPIARAPGDEINRCGEEPIEQVIFWLVVNHNKLSKIDTMHLELRERMDEVQMHVDTTKAAKQYFKSDKKDAEAKLGKQLIRCDTLRFKNAELFQIYETIKVALEDIIWNLAVDVTPSKINETLTSVRNLRKYANTTLSNFAKLTGLKAGHM